MNILTKYKKVHFYESVWRKNKYITPKDIDINNKPFPYPTKNKIKLDSKYNKLIIKLTKINKILDSNKKFKKYKKYKKCLISNKKNITKKLYNLNNVHWEDSLIYYMKNFNIRPSNEFVKFINSIKIINNKIMFKNEIVKKHDVISNLYVKKKSKFLKLTNNHTLIFDALLESGGNSKKYDINKKSKYSEHSGLLDFNNKGLEKIIVSGVEGRVDDSDDDIIMPEDMKDIYDYEFFFHTHPPTPKPGSRAEEGILYEFPSTSDIFHFIHHYNYGKTQGSIVVTPEGMYIIRALNEKVKINIKNDKEVYDNIEKKMFQIQDEAIKKYGTKFNRNFFYSEIAQNTEYIKKFNKFLKKYNIVINYHPRKKINKKWLLGNIKIKLNPIEKRK